MTLEREFVKSGEKYFIYSTVRVLSVSHSALHNSLGPHGLLCPWNSPGKNTGVGSHSLLQGIFPIQGSNPGLLHCRQILYHLSHQRKVLKMMRSLGPFVLKPLLENLE